MMREVEIVSTKNSHLPAMWESGKRGEYAVCIATPRGQQYKPFYIERRPGDCCQALLPIKLGGLIVKATRQQDLGDGLIISVLRVVEIDPQDSKILAEEVASWDGSKWSGLHGHDFPLRDVIKAVRAKMQCRSKRCIEPHFALPR